jgi:hypothetical protein
VTGTSTAASSGSAYLRVFLLTVCAGLLVTLTTNAMVDPYGITPWSKGTARQRVLQHLFGARTITSIRLGLFPYDAVILGTSRAAVLPPDHPAFEGRRVFNAALMQSSMVELGSVFDFAADRQSLDSVVVGLDFLAFSDQRTVGGDFERSAFAGRSPWLILAGLLVSGQTLKQSVVSLERPEGDGPGIIELVARGGGGETSTRDRFDRVLQYFLTYPPTYACYRYDPGRLEILGRMLERARSDGFRVVLYFSPIHARMLETLRALGLYETFESWKRGVTRRVAEAADRGARVSLWDFSGYNPITTEPIPDGDRPMRWYREPSHYREELAGILLSRMLPEDAPSAYADGFGVRLTPENVDAHFERDRRAREAWAGAQPREVGDVERRARRTEDRRRKACARS